jgi:hypothetical protein
MTTIRVRYNSLDRFSQSRTFKTLEGARRYAQKWVGAHPDHTAWYAVSNDGVGRVTASVPMTDLFPSDDGCGCMTEPDERGVERVVTHSSTCPQYLGY